MKKNNLVNDNNNNNKKIKSSTKKVTSKKVINNKAEKKTVKKKVNNQKKDKNTKSRTYNYLFNTIVLSTITFLIELLFRFFSGFGILSYATLRILIGCIIISLFVSFLSNLPKKRWLCNFINFIFLLLYTIYTWLQIGFINYLGVYISFHTSSQFGAVKDYIGDFIESIQPIYYLLFIPLLIFLIISQIIDRKTKYKRLAFKKWYKAIITLFVLFLVYYGTISIPFMQNRIQQKSNIALFINPDVPTLVVNQYGVVGFGVLDFKSFIFPVEEKIEYGSLTHNNKKTSREGIKYLEAIAEDETNNKYKAINNYFASQSIEDYNNYTGMFEGKNVIIILMESVNGAIIDEENFPNYYKLYSGGWFWENNYSPRNSCATGNNEFSTLTSLYSIYNTCTSNSYKNNTYFEAIFNLFNDKGYDTTSMHDFVEWYYARKIYQINMGSNKYYNAKDLNIKTSGTYGEWPSDEEFLEKAMDIVINRDKSKPFMTFLTTVTSHQPYTNSSTYGDLYLKYFKKQGYSDAASRYLSKVKVLDDGIGKMIDILKENGEFDNTVFFFLPHHYPYGLNKSRIKELVSYDLNDYDIEKTPLLIYNSKMQHKVFSSYSSYINIIPTIANLMNLNYDSRLYMGQDLLSDNYESIVVFADGSWKNENVYYNASTGKIKCYIDSCDENMVKDISIKVRNKIDISSKAIKTNYFAYLQKKIEEYKNKELENDLSKND